MHSVQLVQLGIKFKRFVDDFSMQTIFIVNRLQFTMVSCAFYSTSLDLSRLNAIEYLLFSMASGVAGVEGLLHGRPLRLYTVAS